MLIFQNNFKKSKLIILLDALYHLLFLKIGEDVYAVVGYFEDFDKEAGSKLNTCKEGPLEG